MARRRQLGEALMNIGDLLTRLQFNRMGAEHQSELVRRRQIELAELEDRNEILKTLLGDTTGRKAQMLVDAGMGQYSRFVPKPEAAQATIGAGIAEISDLAKLPTGVDIESIVASTPGARGLEKDPRVIERFLGQVRDRRGAIEAAEPFVSRTKMGADGVQVQEYVQPRQAAEAGAVPTERTGAQEGLRQGQTKLGELQTPGLLEARVKDANLFESGTREEIVRTAGAKAGAEAAARNEAELRQLENPRWLEAKAKELEQELTIKAAREGDKAKAEMITQTVQAIGSVTADWEIMKILSKQVNTGMTAQPFTYYGTSKLQLNPTATRLDSIGANLSKRLANHPLLGGNKGAQSEKDSQAILGRLPNSYDSEEVAKQKIIDFENNIYKGLAAISAMPTTASPQERVNAMRAALGLDTVDITNPSPVDDPQVILDRATEKWDRRLGGGDQ